jgi:hypothetical protein
MKTRLKRHIAAWLLVAAAAVSGSSGCDPEPSARPTPVTPQTQGKVKEAPARKVEIAPNIFLEIQGQKRRVLVSASVCLRKGALELLMTRKDAKEHESVLAADLDARKLRFALEAAGARAGAPVQYDPYKPASGQTIKITVEFNHKGKVVSLPAQEWVRDAQTKKVLNHDWVFAGSRLVANPLDRNKPIFLANDGDLVCVSNFEQALLDLPIKSSKANSELAFEANTDRIPELGTKVTVIFEPVPEKKKAK